VLAEETVTHTTNNKHKHMLLAQIAGYPGAGKTTLCATLRALYGDDRLLVIDTDDAVGDLTAFVEGASARSNVPVIAVGTFGLDPGHQPNGYPVFASHFYWWLDVPLEECMERALRRQVAACHERLDGFVALQKSQTAEETSLWLNNYLNAKVRGAQWKGLKDLFLNETNDAHERLFEVRTADEILLVLRSALGEPSEHPPKE